MRLNVKYEILEMTNIGVENSAFVLEEIKAVNELDRCEKSACEKYQQ